MPKLSDERLDQVRRGASCMVDELLAHIDALRTELAEANQTYASAVEGRSKFRGAFREAKAELAEARKDAERLNALLARAVGCLEAWENLYPDGGPVGAAAVIAEYDLLQTVQRPEAGE